MKNLEIKITNELDLLNDFFEKNHLEISDAEPVETNVIKAWKVTDSDNRLIGGICLAFRENEYIIDGIAVDESLRGQKIGTELLLKAKEEVKKLKGNKIYLVAKAPEFFKTQGFKIITQEEAPLFYECATCPQFNVDCFPEIMSLEV